MVKVIYENNCHATTSLKATGSILLQLDIQWVWLVPQDILEIRIRDQSQL